MALIDRFLARAITRGTLTLTDPAGTRRFGRAEDGWPDVVIRFTDAGVGRFIATRPRLGAAEAFIDGRLIVERGDIMSLVSLLRRNNAWEDGGTIDDASLLRRGLSAALGKLGRLNWERKSRANVAHHYDLDERLYRLFLDDDLQYSCAYFRDPATSLAQAQSDKKAHIAAKLALSPGQRVLDIGCGWGGTALHLHRHHNDDVLGITLSAEQLRVARARAVAEGVADRVKFELIDYRRLTGRFDRIVSIGMFEHVGPPHYRAFFAKCRSLLAEDGVMLLHTIGRFGGPGTTDAFTQKYIFPGGYISALSEIVSASEPHRLIATDIETLRLHYALTLHAWYANCLRNRAAIEALYDARFFRMWTFYLAGAATAFEHGGLCNYQLQYARDRRSLPITRDYIGEGEAARRR